MALGVSSACGTGLDPYCVSVATQTKDFFPMNSGNSYFFCYFSLSVFQVAQVCCNCGVCMGEYFCRTCKFFDDDVRWFFFFQTLPLVDYFGRSLVGC